MTEKHARLFMLAGLILMVVAALDPLEGSVVILAGSALLAAGAVFHGTGRYKLPVIALVLVAVGVAALFALSSIGGVGGNSGRSAWWLLLSAPYPIGWVLGIVGGGRALARPRRA
jgi:hypothetical protein